MAPAELPAIPSKGRVARRKAAYFAAVAAGSSYRDRLDSVPRPVQEIADQIRSAS